MLISPPRKAIKGTADPVLNTCRGSKLIKVEKDKSQTTISKYYLKEKAPSGVNEQGTDRL